MKDSIKVGDRVKIDGWSGIAFTIRKILEDDQAIAVMVGDDKKHTVYLDDCIPLKDSEYCSECGQLGCGHGAIEE